MPVDPRILDTPFGHIVAVVVPLVINLGHVAAIVALCLTLLLTLQGRWLPPGRERDRVTWYRRRMTEAALVLTGVAVLLDIMVISSVGWGGGEKLFLLPLVVPIILLACITVVVLLRQFGPSLGIPDWSSRPQ